MTGDMSLQGYYQRNAFRDKDLSIREDMAFDLLIDADHKADNLIDLGCGKGRLLMCAKKFYATATGVDITEPPDKSFNFVKADLNQPLQVIPDYYDTVLCLDVIEHIINPRNLLREAYRICGPGGFIVLTTPNIRQWRRVAYLAIKGRFPKTASRRETYGYDGGHIHFFTAADLKHLLIQAGFKDVEIHKGGLMDDAILIRATKPKTP